MGEYFFVACCASGIAFGFGSLCFMLLMGAERGPDAPPVRWLVSPYNIIFTPHLLTDTGRRYRRWCLRCVLGFLVSWIVAVTTGLCIGLKG